MTAREHTSWALIIAMVTLWVSAAVSAWYDHWPMMVWYMATAYVLTVIHDAGVK